jgi:hypothetical protein
MYTLNPTRIKAAVAAMMPGFVRIFRAIHPNMRFHVPNLNITEIPTRINRRICGRNDTRP